jgi:hypothetical protein
MPSYSCRVGYCCGGNFLTPANTFPICLSGIRWCLAGNSQLRQKIRCGRSRSLSRLARQVAATSGRGILPSTCRSHATRVCRLPCICPLSPKRISFVRTSKPFLNRAHDGRRRSTDLVCLFSIGAAGLWIRSATIEIPNPTENTSFAGTGRFPDALRSQSRWSAAAAVCAAMAALVSQAASLAYPVLARWIGHA